MQVSHQSVDVGVVQPNGLDLDLAATLEAHEERVTEWEAHVERESRFIRHSGADRVIGDIPPLAFEAAARAGVPAVAVANFSWDWILEPYAAEQPRWDPVLDCYRQAYARAARLFRLPLHGEFPAFGEIVDAPLLLRRSTRSREAVRGELGIDPGERRPLVLVSFGGFGHTATATPDGDDLSAFLFVGFGEAPPDFRGPWIPLPHRSPIPHEDLMAACDVVLGKPGYGTVAEALAHGTRFLYVPRENFREMPILEAALTRHATARRLARGDFERGRWRADLEALLAAPPSKKCMATNGAEWIAARLLEAARG